MLQGLLMGALATFFYALFSGARLVYYLALGKKCTVTLGEIQKKEIPCKEDEKKVKYIYFAEVDLYGEKIQTTYENIMSPEHAKTLPAGTVKQMRYNRSSDSLYDWESAKNSAIASAIGLALIVLLFCVLI